MKQTKLDEYGGSCIIEGVVNRKRKEDYDEYYNEYQPIRI